MSESVKNCCTDYQAAEFAEGLQAIASAIRFGARHLGTEGATDDMGAIEGLGQCLLDSSKNLSQALQQVADAIGDLKECLPPPTNQATTRPPGYRRQSKL